jgi:uncharacterized LabA/DUF88 family protein
LEELETTKTKNLVIVDFSNVEKWKISLGWLIGVKQLGQLVKHLSYGSKFLRRFYYGSDFGPKDSSQILVPWSKGMLEKANVSGFEVVTKRVKYIHDPNRKEGLDKKCDLDVEMALDIIKESQNYDTVVVFSGDGDLACVLNYIYETYGKKIVIFASRDHLGKELITLKETGVIKHILFAEDFKYRLDKDRDVSY